MGRYQGYWGLVQDNIIDADLVLANGDEVTVSETSCPDLWWGLRGAGHNFGIVTSFNLINILILWLIAILPGLYSHRINWRRL